MGEVESEVEKKEIGERKNRSNGTNSSTRGWLRVYETYG
jgi:hypothetical protein